MDGSRDRHQRELLDRASVAARAGDMTGFVHASQKAEISAYVLLARLQVDPGLLPEERANLATVARLMDSYRGKHGHLPDEQGSTRPRRSWFRSR